MTVVETVTRCRDLDAMVRFLRNAVGARIGLVSPADAPQVVVLDVAGARIRLERADDDEPIELLVSSDRDETLTAPNGSLVRLVHSASEVVVPDAAPAVVVTAPGDGFGLGRAGMEYRDLLPGRWGGRFIASHIRIAEEGDVADWVHYHRIRFQMIYVAAGWVDVVYEDQGEPFRMHRGDCALQPPGIRHRVLRSSAGLEVVEVGCPAVHDTIADHELELPTPERHPERDFGGQRFVHHVAAAAPTRPWLLDCFAVRDTGIADATGGLATVQVVTRDGPIERAAHLVHRGEFVLVVGLRGGASLDVEGVGAVELGQLGAIALPPATTWSWSSTSEDHEFLLVALDAEAIERTAP